MLCATYLLVFVLIQAYQLIDQVLFNSLIGGIDMLKNFLLPYLICCIGNWPVRILLIQFFVTHNNGFYCAARGQSTCITSEFASGGLADSLTSSADLMMPFMLC
jgi:hypothetical protein